jgi:hypothetical protein
MLDNQDINTILEKLENLEDEELAVELLNFFLTLTSHCPMKNGKRNVMKLKIESMQSSLVYMIYNQL